VASNISSEKGGFASNEPHWGLKSRMELKKEEVKQFEFIHKLRFTQGLYVPCTHFRGDLIIIIVK
jgi:hypothetical protein